MAFAKKRAGLLVLAVVVSFALSLGSVRGQVEPERANRPEDPRLEDCSAFAAERGRHTLNVTLEFTTRAVVNLEALDRVLDISGLTRTRWISGYSTLSPPGALSICVCLCLTCAAFPARVYTGSNLSHYASFAQCHGRSLQGCVLEWMPAHCGKRCEVSPPDCPSGNGRKRGGLWVRSPAAACVRMPRICQMLCQGVAP